MVNWSPSVRSREKGAGSGVIVLELHVEFVAVRPGHHWAACERAATGRGIRIVPYSKGSCPLEEYSSQHGHWDRVYGWGVLMMSAP